MPARPDPIDAIVGDYMTAGQIPGAAVAVIDRGKLVKLAGYGTANVEWAACAGADTRFQLASATKIFTGVVLMRLVERGKIGLDDPLTRWFPDAPQSWGDIRVRQLANHSSGLPDDLGPAPRKSVADIVAAAKTRPLAYPPGSEARYGFTDFVVLRAALEKASGKTLPELIREEITAPLGMADTGFALAVDDGMERSGEVLPHAAATYGLRDGRLVTSDFFFGPEGYGAGGLYSSIRDLATLFAALDEGRLLRPASLAALETPAALPNGKISGFGVGWTVRRYHGVPVVGHSGGPALADILRVEDRKLTIVALTNQRTFYPLLAEAIVDRFVPAPAAEPAIVDRRPALTDRVRAALNGTRDASLFAASAQDIAGQFSSPFVTALFAGVGPVKELRLVGEGAGERRYRVRFARKEMGWIVSGAEDDRIGAIRPE